MVGGATQVKLTAVVCGVLEAPVALIVIVPLYVPADRPEHDAVTVIESVSVVAVPDVGDVLSQEALSLIL